MPVLAMGVIACETRSYQSDREFKSWFLLAETRCNQRHPSFPLYTDKDREQFMGLLHGAYQGRTSPSDLAAQLSRAYPDHTAHAHCLAKSLPQ
jgi:hypothetical protein